MCPSPATSSPGQPYNHNASLLEQVFVAVKKLQLFFTKVAFMRIFDCERLDTTYFRLRILGQKPRFSVLPPLISVWALSYLQGCQVVISKKGQINPQKKPNSTEKSQIHDKYTTPLKHPNAFLKGKMYIFYT